MIGWNDWICQQYRCMRADTTTAGIFEKYMQSHDLFLVCGQIPRQLEYLINTCKDVSSFCWKRFQMWIQKPLLKTGSDMPVPICERQHMWVQKHVSMTYFIWPSHFFLFTSGGGGKTLQSKVITQVFQTHYIPLYRFARPPSHHSVTPKVHRLLFMLKYCCSLALIAMSSPSSPVVASFGIMHSVFSLLTPVRVFKDDECP